MCFNVIHLHRVLGGGVKFSDDFGGRFRRCKQANPKFEAAFLQSGFFNGWHVRQFVGLGWRCLQRALLVFRPLSRITRCPEE